MIVIATHNGEKYLINLLDDIKKFHIPNEKVCVVDNLSTDELHLDYLKELKEDGYNILYNPKSTYGLGAYKYALNNLKDDVWFCFSDSIRIKNDVFSYVIPRLTDNNVYTFVTFEYAKYDNNYDRTFILIHYGTMHYSKGIAGAMMFAKNDVLQKVKNDWYLPISKSESASTDRGIAAIFDKYNIEIIGLDTYSPERFDDPNAYYYFSKTYANRK